MPILNRGLVQIYTGNGKGKTTAAMGLAWRMLGAGGRVYLCQFLKPDGETGGKTIPTPLSDPQSQPALVFDRVDQPWNMADDPSKPACCQAMRQAIDRKLDEIKAVAAQGDYDMVILDELVYCLSKGLADRRRVEDIIDLRARHVELVLTGRGADPLLIDRADLVSEIQEIKHPYSAGISARRGIEF